MLQKCLTTCRNLLGQLDDSFQTLGEYESKEIDKYEEVKENKEIKYEKQRNEDERKAKEGKEGKKKGRREKIEERDTNEDIMK
jgi:hypothetical protein